MIIYGKLLGADSIRFLTEIDNKISDKRQYALNYSDLLKSPAELRAY